MSVFWQGFEKQARGSRIYSAYADYLQKNDPKLFAELEKFEEAKGWDDYEKAKAFQKKYLPSYKKFLKARDSQMAEMATKEWKRDRNKPSEIKRSLGERVKGGLGLGAASGAIGGGLSYLATSPLRLFGNKGRLAANALTGAGTAVMAGGGIASGAKKTRKNPYSGMSQAQLKKKIKSESDSTYMPELYDLKDLRKTKSVKEVK